jgi:hypothetical protein
MQLYLPSTHIFTALRSFTQTRHCLCLTVHAGITFYLNDTISINLLGTDERVLITEEHDNQHKLPDI